MTTGNNQFLPFATGSSANVLTAAEYEALTALVANGFQSGIAQSQQVNTPIRQATFVAAAIAQIIADTGVNANDDGNLTEFKTALMNALGVTFYPNSNPAGYITQDATARSEALAAQASANSALSGNADDSYARSLANNAQATANAAYPASNPSGFITSVNGLGYGGTSWHGVYRAFNTTYYNPYSYPIAVSATATCAVTSVIYAYVNGQLVSFFQWQFNGCGSFGGAFIIVPPGASYSLNSSQGVYNWVELY